MTGKGTWTFERGGYIGRLWFYGPVNMTWMFMHSVCMSMGTLHYIFIESP
ncbi:hypothetical protein CPC08DRAFT_704515 [Agrocybe pediades]|nr:hypothetical protein CPC08DRAFT_704515 [Agrocybe pediades]